MGGPVSARLRAHPDPCCRHAHRWRDCRTLLGELAGVALEVVLSFGSAALRYLVVEELPREAHEVQETPLIPAAFFAGFVASYLLELVA
jgi:hypothetical protein